MENDKPVKPAASLPVTDVQTGLTDAAVMQLRQQYGYNEVKEKHTPALVLFARHFWGLTAWMLEATVVISFLLHKTFGAWVILALLVFLMNKKLPKQWPHCNNNCR